MAYAPSATVARSIACGDRFDLAITSPRALDPLAAAGLVLAEPRGDVGITAAMLAWRHSTPAPYRSGEAVLRAALLPARAIAFSDPGSGGSSSNDFVAVVARLGQGGEVRAKSILTQPAEGAMAVAEGRADLAAAQASEVAMAPEFDPARLNPFDPASSSCYGAAVAELSRGRRGAGDHPPVGPCPGVLLVRYHHQGRGRSQIASG